MKLYRIVNILASLLFICLFLLLMFAPKRFITDAGLQPDTASLVIARRAACFMIGISFLLFANQNLKPGKELKRISAFAAIIFYGLAIMSLYEYIRGTVNTSIITAAVIESLFGTAYTLILVLSHRQNKSI